MPKLSDLLNPKPRTQILQELLSLAQAEGLATTDWYPGSVARTILEVNSAALADLYVLVAKIAAGGYLDSAEGEWLDLLAWSQYNETRKPATYAQGIVQLRARPGLGPYTIQPGQLWLGTPDGLRFSNMDGGTLPQGGTLTITVRAESPGKAYNVPAGTISIMHTPLPGVTVTNPPNWLTQAGADAESDESLRNRCRLKWATLGTGMTRAAYEYYALSAHPSVTKVRVLDNLPRGQGTVDVVVWGDGGIGPDAVAAVDSVIQSKRPVTANVLVYAATARTIPVNATISVRAGFLPQAQAAVSQALTQLQRDTPIGGTIYRAALYEALFPRPYGVNVVLNAPTIDVTLGTAEAPVISASLTWQEVV